MTSRRMPGSQQAFNVLFINMFINMLMKKAQFQQLHKHELFDPHTNPSVIGIVFILPIRVLGLEGLKNLLRATH